MNTNNNRQKTVKPLKKIDVTGTIESLEIGQEVFFKLREAKLSTIRAVAYRTTEKKFEVTEADLYGKTKVTRLE